MKNSIQIKAADTLKAAHGYSANVVRLRNTSAVSIDYSVSGGSAVELAAGASAIVDVAGLTSEIAVRRTDLSATPANVLLEFGLTADEAYEQSAAAAATSAAATAAAAVAGHNEDQTAHGFGVYTVAQLNAFTNANRPTGCVLCSDCLVPEGVGSPVIWSGTAWVCTYCGMPATTSLLTYYREIRKRGCDIDTESQFSAFLRPNRFGGTFSTGSGSGAAVDPAYDLGTLLYLVGAVGYSTALVQNFGIQPTTRNGIAVRVAESSLYYASDVYVSAASDATEEYAILAGFLDPTQIGAIGTSFIGVVYDRGNSVGIGNTGNSANLFAVTRSANVNTVTNTTAALGSGRDNVKRVEVLKVGSTVTTYIGGLLVAEHTTNIPSANLQPRTLVVKTAGTTIRYAGVNREFFTARF